MSNQVKTSVSSVSPLTLSFPGGQIVFPFEVAQNQSEGEVLTLRRTLSSHFEKPEIQELYGILFATWQERHPGETQMTLPFVLDSKRRLPGQTGCYGDGKIWLPDSYVGIGTILHEGIHALQGFLCPDLNNCEIYPDITSFATVQLMTEAETALKAMLVNIKYDTNFKRTLDIASFIGRHKNIPHPQLRQRVRKKFYPHMPQGTPNEFFDQVIGALATPAYQQEVAIVNKLHLLEQVMPPQRFNATACSLYFDQLMGPGSDWRESYAQAMAKGLAPMQYLCIKGAIPHNPDGLSLEDYISRNKDPGYVAVMTQRLLDIGLSPEQIQGLKNDAKEIETSIRDFGIIARDRDLPGFERFFPQKPKVKTRQPDSTRKQKDNKNPEQ